MSTKRIVIDISPEEYEQITCDIENSIEEFTELSHEVEWFATDMPERLRTALQILKKDQE